MVQHPQRNVRVPALAVAGIQQFLMDCHGPRLSGQTICRKPKSREACSDHDLAPDGCTDANVLRWQTTDANLRRRMAHIDRTAGFGHWPKIFHNLRALGLTELEDQFPSHVVRQWLGNAEAVA